MTSKYASFESAEQILREESLHNEFVFCGKYAKDWIERCKQMLPEIDRLKIWKKKGFESIYHYAATFAGMSRWAVTDALRVMRKAESFPEIQQLIRDKGVNAARPIVAIATKENAGSLAHKARVMGKSSLETYLKERKKQEHGGVGDQSANRLEFGTNTTVAEMTLDPEVASELLKLKGQGDWNSLIYHRESPHVSAGREWVPKSSFSSLVVKCRHGIEETSPLCVSV